MAQVFTIFVKSLAIFPCFDYIAKPGNFAMFSSFRHLDTQNIAKIRSGKFENSIQAKKLLEA